MRHPALLLASACLASCAAAPTQRTSYEIESLSSLPGRDLVPQGGPVTPPPSASSRPDWRIGEPLMQGFLGVSEYTSIHREGGGSPDVDGDEGNLDEMPILGGGGQWKLGGENIDYGLEALFSFGGRANASAF